MQNKVDQEALVSDLSIKTQELTSFIRKHHRLFVITGAGVSTASGIPDYRDENGDWKRQPPVMHQDFIQSELVRQRYWARSLIGWRFFGNAAPNASHKALQQLETQGYVQLLLTQNVDGLHQRAGSRKVLDLHGRIDSVRCLSCGKTEPRNDFQQRLEVNNQDYAALTAAVAPDGDADLEQRDFSDFIIPQCLFCAGACMPDVVFYGGSVPKKRIDRAYQELDQAEAVLVLGSSLGVYSAYQFCKYASQRDIPVVAVNRGKTRHDGNYRIKLEVDCEDALPDINNLLFS